MRKSGIVVLAMLVLGLGTTAEADGPPSAGAPARNAVEVTSRLHEALEARDEEGAVEALEAAHGSADEKLVREVRRALHARGRAVRHAAARALGRMPSLAALDALEDELRTNDSLGDDEELFALVLQEIGRHGNPRSVDVLLGDLFRWLTVASGTARLMALANIRSPATVEGLLAAGKKTGGGAGRSGARSDVVEGLRPAFRVAMVVLTGHDEGPGAGLAWERWWKDEGKKAGVRAERPAVPAEVRAFWEAFWREPYGGESAPPAPTRRAVLRLVREPTPEQAAEATAALRAAFDGKSEEALAEALQRYGGVQDKSVVHEVARGLTSRSARVRWIAIDVLGWSPDKRALKQLHRMVARERDLARDDAALFAHLLKAIGRHGDKSSIEVLTDDPLRNLTYASGRARILGLARIREREAIEELFKGMRLAGERPRRRGGASVAPRFLGEFRLALWVLTGEDRGATKDDWIAWWRKADTTFKVSETPPPLPAPLEAAWEEYWDEPYGEPGR